MFSLPSLLLYTVFFIVPVFIGLFYSFTDWNGLSKDYNWVGFQNFIAAFSDTTILQGLQNTIVFTVLTVIFQNILGLFLAVILTSTLKGKRILRTVFFWPVLLSSLVMSYIWSYLYRYQDGFFNQVLRFIGLGSLAQDWLGDQKLALLSIIFATVWQMSGFFMVIYITGIESISKDVYEASSIDGTNTWQKFFYITFPLLAPSFTICTTLGTVWGLNVFNQVLIMTNGGPGNATESIASLIYKKAFHEQNFGIACALSAILFLFVAIVSIAQTSVLRKREVHL